MSGKGCGRALKSARPEHASSGVLMPFLSWGTHTGSACTAGGCSLGTRPMFLGSTCGMWQVTGRRTAVAWTGDLLTRPREVYAAAETRWPPLFGVHGFFDASDRTVSISSRNWDICLFSVAGAGARRRATDRCWCKYSSVHVTDCGAPRRGGRRGYSV